MEITFHIRTSWQIEWLKVGTVDGGHARARASKLPYSLFLHKLRKCQPLHFPRSTWKFSVQHLAILILESPKAYLSRFPVLHASRGTRKGGQMGLKQQSPCPLRRSRQEKTWDWSAGFCKGNLTLVSIIKGKVDLYTGLQVWLGESQ